MTRDLAIATARGIMLDFAGRTGLAGSGAPRRYLWTDAHAVCNFLSLYRATGEAEFRDLARALVDQVHEVLGRYRDDDTRSGRLSGLSGPEGQAHPTAGGLRIGKPLPERQRDEPFDERLEWDRDGQYFHYLTRWMHALARTAAVTGDAKYCRWAIELAIAAHRGFARAVSPGHPKRLCWKMSVDLRDPLVPSTGQHDALDGYVTSTELAHVADRFGLTAGMAELERVRRDTRAMFGPRHWQTEDPLGIGGLLFDACRLLELESASLPAETELALAVLRVASGSLACFPARAVLSHPAGLRLAFRELGLATGLLALPRMRRAAAHGTGRAASEIVATLSDLSRYESLAPEITAYWTESRHQAADSWTDHRDINAVMLATCLLPDEFLAA